MATQQTTPRQSAVSMFSALKTTDQSTNTSNAIAMILWETKDEYNNENNFNTSENCWTAPADGWLEVSATLSVTNGTGADDTMTWGFRIGSVYQIAVTDNWRYQTMAGIDYVTTLSGAFRVNKDDQVFLKYDGTSYAILMIANKCHMSGRFTRDG